MKLKNKFILSLGTTASVVAPLATVVACSDTKTVTQTAIEQRELWAKSQPTIETKYQEMLIAQVSSSSDHPEFGTIKESDLQSWDKISSNAKIVELITQLIKQNIYATPTYLQTFAAKLLHTINDKASTAGMFYQYSELAKDGFYDSFLAKTDITTDNKENSKIDDLIKKYIAVIWNNNIANFRNSIYHYIIASYYLDTTKDNYTNVFITPAGSTKTLSGTEGLLDPTDHFVLAQKTLAAKYAFDWKVTLDAPSSKAYSGVKMDSATLDAELTKPSGTTASIYTHETTTSQRALLPSFFQDEKSNTGFVWKDLVAESNKISGFAGLVDKSTFASTETILKQAVDDASYDKIYEGYVDSENSKIVDEKAAPIPQIKLTTPANATVTIEKVLMLLPKYVNGQLSINYLNDSSNDYSLLKRIILSQQLSAIYTEAIQYFSSKDNQEFNWDKDKKVGGIRLTILDDSLRKMALDTFQLDYVMNDDETSEVKTKTA